MKCASSKLDIDIVKRVDRACSTGMLADFLINADLPYKFFSDIGLKLLFIRCSYLNGILILPRNVAVVCIAQACASIKYIQLTVLKASYNFRSSVASSTNGLAKLSCEREPAVGAPRWRTSTGRAARSSCRSVFRRIQRSSGQEVDSDIDAEIPV